MRNRRTLSSPHFRRLEPRLRVGFILARRFTLCAFANFVDVLRLAADEGDRSRPILCDWVVLSHNLDPIPSSCGILIQPTAPLRSPQGFDYIVVVGGLMDEIPNVPRQCCAFFRQEPNAALRSSGYALAHSSCIARDLWMVIAAASVGSIIRIFWSSSTG